MNDDLVQVRPEGLYVPRGDFHIDPWKPVPRAVITHAHGDHARSGSGQYWGAAAGLGLLRERLGKRAVIEPVAYGQRFTLGEVTVSLHPAGHVLGSAQVRIEATTGNGANEVWVVSGDYKRDPDPTCAPFEVVPCDTFITEATFGLPVYRWTDTRDVAREILSWWIECRDTGKTAVLFCWALGKAQRVLAELQRLRTEIEAAGLNPVVALHGAMPALIKVYREAGIDMLPGEPVSNLPKGTPFAGRLVLAPPGASGTPWMRRFDPYSTGFASGWMRVRGGKRRLAYDRGFTLSDHADWPSLLRTIEQTGARRVLATHGNTDALIEVLRARGLQADELQTRFEGEAGAADAVVSDEVNTAVA
jgi:putative mRNA 3-end processing factor